MNKNLNMPGFSIIEFLIAMSIGMIVIGGVISVYITNKTSSNIQNAKALLQNNGRYISYITNKHLRMAAYQGCINSNNMAINNIVSPSNTNYEKIDFTHPIKGYSSLNFK